MVETQAPEEPCNTIKTDDFLLKIFFDTLIFETLCPRWDTGLAEKK